MLSIYWRIQKRPLISSSVRHERRKLSVELFDRRLISANLTASCRPIYTFDGGAQSPDLRLCVQVKAADLNVVRMVDDMDGGRLVIILTGVRCWLGKV